MPESIMSPVPVVIKRACDCCHKRKVKCIGDGSRPCKNCSSAGLTCTYNAVPQKKGPKGSRAKVISELRETQKQHIIASVGQPGFAVQGHQYTSPFAPTPGLLPMELITSCVDYFFANMYPTQPILHRIRVGETIGQMDNSVEAYCLASSLCAYMLIQPNMVFSGSLPSTPETEAVPPTNLSHGHRLIQETLRVRKGYDYTDSPSVWSVVTSFFLFGSYFCLDKHNTAWFHLREATTLAHLIGMHEEESYQLFDHIESSRRRRLYWLLFVTERAYALQRHHPLTLYNTIELPSIDEDPAESLELSGFLHLVNLFRPFDHTFVQLWNRTGGPGCTSEWLALLQNQLSEALPVYLQSTEIQAVDLQISKQWLKTMVWQLSISHGFLSSMSQEKSMSLNYPIEIARDLIAATSNFSQEAMEVHGIGLVEKLFDIACTLTDVMSCVPIEQQGTFEFGPRDYLNQILSIISKLRGGQQRYYPLLATKINDTLPFSVPSSVFPHGPNAQQLHPRGMAHTRLDDIYDTQIFGQPRSHGSNTTSADTTPFGSPPRSSSTNMGPPPFNFDDLTMDPAGDVPFGPLVCEPMQFSAMTASAMAQHQHQHQQHQHHHQQPQLSPSNSGIFHGGYSGQMAQGMKHEGG